MLTDSVIFRTISVQSRKKVPPPRIPGQLTRSSLMYCQQTHLLKNGKGGASLIWYNNCLMHEGVGQKFRVFTPYIPLLHCSQENFPILFEKLFAEGKLK